MTQIIALAAPKYGNSNMWLPTKPETIEMYARFWMARYGHSASSSARKMAKSLREIDDPGGEEAWNAVADAIERRQQNKHRVSR